MIEFEYPFILLSLLAIPALVYWYLRKGQHQEGTMRYSDISLIPKEAIQRGRLKHRLLLLVKVLIIALILTALSRPRLSNTIKETRTDIVDIMLWYY